MPLTERRHRDILGDRMVVVVLLAEGLEGEEIRVWVECCL